MCFIRGVIGAILGGRVREGRRCTDGILRGSSEDGRASMFVVQGEFPDSSPVCEVCVRMKED